MQPQSSIPTPRLPLAGELVRDGRSLIWDPDADSIGISPPATTPDHGMIEPKRAPAPGDNAAQGGARGPLPARWFEPGTVSIRDFLTDGSLARLCDEVARLTGVPIWLRDLDGQVIIPAEGGGPGRPTWRVVDGEHGAMRAFALVGRSYTGTPDLFVSPLRTSVGELGAIVMPADWGNDDPVERRALERAVTLLGRSALEACEGQIAIQHRVNELDAMFRLSSALTQAGDPDRVLGLALDMALETLRMDAGTISVFEEPAPAGGGPASEPAPEGGVHASAVLRHRAVRHLSEEWLTQVTPISIDGTLRAAALRGEVVTVEELRSDPRIADHERAQREGLASLILTGLIYQGRATGLIRLYSRKPRTFSNQEKELLRSIADHAASVLATARLRELRQQDRELQRQLKIAADVQKRMLPRQLPQVPQFELAARYAPTYQIGGDFYDLFESGGQLGLIVGDVAGKGVPAALIMSSVRATARAFFDSSAAPGSRGPALDRVAADLNRAVVRDTLDSEFVTLWCGVVDPVTLRASVVSAGHDPAMLFRPEGGRVEVLEMGSGGMALGIDPEQTYDVAAFDLRPGDIVLAFTDGLTDAANFDDRKFGKDRVRDTVAALLTSEPTATAARIVEHLMWSLRQFRGLRLATDDVTIVAVRVR